MFLEIFTLLVLILVLMIRYATTMYTDELKQRYIEIQNNCRREEARHKALIEQRGVLEEEERSQEKDFKLLEVHVVKMRETLADQVSRNREMEERFDQRS